MTLAYYSMVSDDVMNEMREYYEAVAKMPPLRHKVGEVFDIEKSEVVKWLMEQPNFKKWVFARIYGAGRIVYDAATGTWSGVPYEDVLKNAVWNQPAGADRKGGRPVTVTTKMVAGLVKASPGLSAYELSKPCGISPGTLANALKRAQVAGLVEKRETKWYPKSVEVVDVE